MFIYLMFNDLSWLLFSIYQTCVIIDLFKAIYTYTYIYIYYAREVERERERERERESSAVPH